MHPQQKHLKETELQQHMAIRKKKKAKKAAVKLSYSVSLHGTYTDLHFISSFYVHLLDAVGKKMLLFSLKSREFCKSASAVDITQINQSKRTQERKEKETCAAQCLDRSLTPRTAAPNMCVLTKANGII